MFEIVGSEECHTSIITSDTVHAEFIAHWMHNQERLARLSLKASECIVLPKSIVVEATWIIEQTTL